MTPMMNMQENLFNVPFQDLSCMDNNNKCFVCWSTPSSGDWVLYIGGTFYFENPTNCNTVSLSFHQFDSNWIALYSYYRDLFIRNDFCLIGDIVIGLLGKTKDYTYDVTIAPQSRFTNIIENYVDDIGLCQLPNLLFQSNHVKFTWHEI